MSVPFLAQRPGIGVHQRRKLVELRNDYHLVDETGREVGTAQQVRQTPLAFLARLFSNLDMMLPTRIEVRDEAGAIVMTIDKPWFTTAVTAATPDGQPLGTVTKRIRMGKARFRLTAPGGEDLGEVHAQNWRARDFAVFDTTQTEAARVTKQWRGLLTEGFSNADSYAVTFRDGLTDPLRSLAFTAALAVDLVLKQKRS